MDDISDLKDSIREVETDLEKEQILDAYSPAEQDSQPVEFQPHSTPLEPLQRSRQSVDSRISQPVVVQDQRRASEGQSNQQYYAYRPVMRPMYRPPVQYRPVDYRGNQLHRVPEQPGNAPVYVRQQVDPNMVYRPVSGYVERPMYERPGGYPTMSYRPAPMYRPERPFVPPERSSSPAHSVHSNNSPSQVSYARPMPQRPPPMQYQYVRPVQYSHPNTSPSIISNGPVMQPSRRGSDSSMNTTMQGNNSTMVKEALIPHENLESYRQEVKKSNDPIKQFQFAKQLILVAEEMRKNPQGLDASRVRKNRDILHSEAVRWIKKAAQASYNGKTGYPEASFFLADCYGNGTLGLTVDHDRAFGYYVQGAKQDHSSSIYRTGVCYEVGAGTKRDHVRAVQYYKKAAALGDTAAMYKIGMILLNGTLGQQRNPREGVNYLKRAANQADETTPYALHELATLYEGINLDPTIGVVPDPSYSFELYLKSAKLGYAASQYKLGLVYEYGHLGLGVDPPRSIAWYTKAAQQGDPDAELALSGWYLTGFETILPRNELEAYMWARKAAEKGLAKAEYALGYFLEHGVGVQEDLEEARRWYVRSASQGNVRAIARLKGAHAQETKPSNWRAEADAQNGNCNLM